MTTNPITISLVDDYLRIRKFIGKYLSSNGFTVVSEANNGQELLAELETANSLPHLCLLDIDMPVMDGYETARQLKNKYPGIGILAYSCFDDQPRIEKVLDCGADEFIVKTSSREEVKSALLDVLAKTGRHAEYSLA